MTKEMTEMIRRTAQEIVQRLQWSTEDEERQVMELVQKLLRQKRQPQGNQRGNI